MIFNFFSNSEWQKHEGIPYFADDEGLKYEVRTSSYKTLNALEKAQFKTLMSLVEQGIAEKVATGFLIASEIVVLLDSEYKELLKLPPTDNHEFKTDIQGISTQSSFAIIPSIKTFSGRYTTHFSLNGPFITLGEEQFTLPPVEFKLFQAITLHSQSGKTETDNLMLLLAFQDAQKAGLTIDLSHFEKKDLKAPESITISVEVDTNGDLVLTPNLGQSASKEKLERCLHQLRSTGAQHLRIGQEIIILKPETAAAVKEILQKRHIPKSKAEKFLKAPAEHFQSGYINLDAGFSYRVHGAAILKHAYFGDTDESGIEWFGKEGLARGFETLIHKIEDSNQLQELKEVVENAKQTGATEIIFDEQSFTLPADTELHRFYDQIQTRLDTTVNTDKNKEADETEIDEIKEMPVEPFTAVVNLALNDDQLEFGNAHTHHCLNDVLYNENLLDFSQYKRQPFPHQMIGVRWILGLATQKQNTPQKGGLLADDMGLGKTFMALAALEHFYKLDIHSNAQNKPSLIIAPLSLLENWKDEVLKTFNNSPFHDIIILQSDSDLKRFKVGGSEVKNQNISEDGILNATDIKYSLKLGEQHFGDERLDMPNRLVITTYDTLSDYQFSLCSIAWAMVIFDEAQNIKNPNTLRTRAAKGLYSDFNLVATGTPVENSLRDLWCIMDTACPGFLGSYQEFRQDYISPINRAPADQISQIRYEYGVKLREKLGVYMLRRIKEDSIQGLPAKYIYAGHSSTEERSWLFKPELSSIMRHEQLEAYDAVIEHVRNSEKPIYLAALQQLRSVSLHPYLQTSNGFNQINTDQEHQNAINSSGKFIILQKLLDEIRDRKEKCIIFTINKKLQTYLSTCLEKMYGLKSVDIINGDTKTVSKNAQTSGTRKSIISHFEAQDGFNVIIMSPEAAGVGLTVVGANNVIHLERLWNPAKEAQATDRVYRIGQTKDVNVYIPILSHPEFESFDVNLLKLLGKKVSLKDAVVTPEDILPAPGGFHENDGILNTSRPLNIKDISKLDWQHFEALTLELLSREYDAHESSLTQSGRDKGVDAFMSTASGDYLIQCKQCSNKIFGSDSEIRKFIGATKEYNKALSKNFSHFIFISSAKQFSKTVQSAALENNVELIALNKIEKMLKQHKITRKQIEVRLTKSRILV